ncbi:hypothetical protein GCM10025876_10360 [Demequina litorisediminis]|uniref:Uncharacterized protein n=1 Tax=Demequina litorisediminis TaxID=1849022 RepID=A0ABQ6ICC9_9MICO|nr:hypothetical protein GCM10025876_10360 [Demequina litorisediminis]
MPRLRRAVRDGAPLGRGDDGLRRHHVGQDGVAAESLPFDEGDLGTLLDCDKGGLVPARAATDDDNAWGHRTIVPHAETRVAQRRQSRHRGAATPVPRGRCIGRVTALGSFHE